MTTKKKTAVPKMRIKRISAKEFRDLGYLQEVNRQFFHPLGLALEMSVEGDGDDEDVAFGGVWDYREVPEGMAFVDAYLETEEAQRKASHIQALQAGKAAERLMRMGYVVQPMPSVTEEGDE